jgi:hypothetical protein
MAFQVRPYNGFLTERNFVFFVILILIIPTILFGLGCLGAEGQWMNRHRRVPFSGMVSNSKGQYHLKSVAVRPFFFYPSITEEYGIFLLGGLPQAVVQLKKGEKITMVNMARSTIPYMHCRRLLLTRRLKSSTYSLSAGIAFTTDSSSSHL